jgi:hypothetical protein
VVINKAIGQTVPAPCVDAVVLLTIGAMYPVAKAEEAPTTVASVAMNGKPPPAVQAHVAARFIGLCPVLLPRMHQLPTNVM